MLVVFLRDLLFLRDPYLLTILLTTTQFLQPVLQLSVIKRSFRKKSETAFNWFIKKEMVVNADETAFNWLIQNEMIVSADETAFNWFI